MRHKKWSTVFSFISQITVRLGGRIYDKRCNRTWDAGQAICAEAYGENWMHHPVFLEWNQKADSEPPEPHYYECARKMAEGYKPEWIKL